MDVCCLNTQTITANYGDYDVYIRSDNKTMNCARVNIINRIWIEKSFTFFFSIQNLFYTIIFSLPINLPINVLVYTMSKKGKFRNLPFLSFIQPIQLFFFFTGEITEK